MRFPEELALDEAKALEHGIKWTREFFENEGIKTAVIGISGGCDSALTAYITTKALGSDNVVGVLMPEEGVTPPEDLNDGKEVIMALGMKRVTLDITPILAQICRMDAELTDKSNRVAYANVKARLRMLLLYKEANKLTGLVVGTDDRSEHILGYFTKYGDGGVDINVPAYLYKTQVRQLLYYIAKRDGLNVMGRIADKKPSPQLWAGQTAENELNMNYIELDRALYYMKDSGYEIPANELVKRTGIKSEVADKITFMEHKNAHKNLQPPSPPLLDSLKTRVKIV